MDKDLQRIEAFIQKHHVLSLATAFGDEVSACSLFYTYLPQERSFIVASSDDTLHIQHIRKNPNIAGNILLETKEIGKIQGLQFQGTFGTLREKGFKKSYFTRFPYALAMNPTLWQIRVDYFKLTDNRLGFGKKLIWQEPSL
ncbi:pyridoxamine 5'-phosphate oxidase family protein [Sulfurimonas paralvinellae]|uniref:Pyridoxamine 5'-phosphate oxidase putative domain-containing protein n=1 Tax=Sulfurimonas paralvinellae TaxID=317658 RepID=A0A7M1B9R9_9BACT|nr:pyridoxamine 5'-phosphate oxidase family protein [Sulfurimonas paralvinellae]QOP46206.1 hypothetical protein FM071_07825 [Sulfurimonas paralvinellae]